MLGGGTFTSQNKKIPGAYINFVSAARADSALSERGIVAIGMSLNWGNDTGVFLVTKDDFIKKTVQIFGYDYSSDELKQLRELFKHATKAYLYRLNAGVKATCDYATAKYSGTRGNDLKIVISENADDSSKWDVSTYLGTALVDEQTKVVDATALKENDFVTFKTDATLTATVGTVLAGGTNGTVTGTQHQAFLSAVESSSFNILASDTSDAPTKALYAAFTKRMREELGVKFQTVLFGSASDYEGVINVKNSVELIPWVAGAEAGCEVNKSLTNMIYDGEYEITTSYTQSQLEDAITAGELAFHKVGDGYRVLVDINSLVTISSDKGIEFKNNQTIRVLDQIGNDTAALFNEKYNGKIPNDASGRISLWNDLVSYYKELEGLRAIENFDAADIEVLKGTGKTDVVANSYVTPTNCMDKLYMTIIVQ